MPVLLLGCPRLVYRGPAVHTDQQIGVAAQTRVLVCSRLLVTTQPPDAAAHLVYRSRVLGKVSAGDNATCGAEAQCVLNVPQDAERGNVGVPEVP